MTLSAPRKSPLFLRVTVLACLAGWTQAGLAQVDPVAAQTVKQMSDTLAAGQDFSFLGTRTLDAALVPATTPKAAQYMAKVKVAVSRPNKFFIKVSGIEDTREFYFNSSEFVLFDAKSNSYGKVLTKSVTIDQMLGHLQTKWGFLPPVSDFIMSDSYKMLMADVQTGKVIGTGMLGAVRAKHLAFTQADVNWDLWVSEDDFLPKRLVIVFKNKPGSPKYQFDFEGWNFKINPSARAFDFVPSKGMIEKDLVPIKKK